MNSFNTLRTRIVARFTLSRMIIGLGLVGMVGAGAVAGVSYWSAQVIDALQAQLTVVSAIENTGHQLGTQILLARRFEKDFIIRRSTEDADRNVRATTQALATLAELKKQTAALEPGRAESLGELEPHLLVYRDAFAALVASDVKLGLNENSGLEGDLRKAVRDAEGRVREARVPELVILALMMRRHEKDYLLRGGLEYRDELVKRANEFNAALEFIPDTSLRDTLRSLIERYRTSFLNYVAEKSHARQKAAELSKTYAQIEPRLKAFDSKLETLTSAVQAEMSGRRAAQDRTTTIIIGTILGLITLLALTISRSIRAPVNAITLAMRRIAKGDFEVDIPGRERRDELRAMADALDVFRNNGIERQALMAQTELERVAQARRQAALEAAISTFDASVAHVMSMVMAASTELHAAAASMSSVAEETLMQCTSVASATDQAVINVNSVAGASEELSTSTVSILKQTEDSTIIAEKAVKGASLTNAKVQELASAAEQIGNVIVLIRGIAAQTNLLALNATIEAARAGDAGKGFAVVAAEVKDLASQTSKATNDVAAAVSAIQDITADSIRTIEEITQIINEMSGISTQVSASVVDQGNATAEIAENIQQAALGVQEVSSAIRHVSSAAATSGSAATQVLDAAAELAQQSAVLRKEMDRFFAEARAA